MKKSLTIAELYGLLAKKYGTGEIRRVKLAGYRNPCSLTPVKIFPNGEMAKEESKAALFFHEDGEDCSIVFCSSLPKNGKPERKLIEIRPGSDELGPNRDEIIKFNINFGETSAGLPRVMRVRSSQDQFNMRARMVAFDIAKDVNFIVHSWSHEKVPSKNGLEKAVIG